MSVGLSIFLFIIIYLLIGYCWACWLSYRVGAGLYVPRDFEGKMDSADCSFHIIAWFLSVSIYTYTSIRDKYSVPKFLKKISPSSFHERGKIANDADYQAEKHLLQEEEK